MDHASPTAPVAPDYGWLSGIVSDLPPLRSGTLVFQEAHETTSLEDSLRAMMEQLLRSCDRMRTLDPFLVAQAKANIVTGFELLMEAARRDLAARVAGDAE